MTVKSARFGKMRLGASDFAEVRNISIEFRANNPVKSSSANPGFEERVTGRRGATVTFEVYYDEDDPIEDRVKEGDLVSLEAFMDYRESGKWTIPVRISSMSYSIPISEDDPPTCNVEGESHGAWTYPDETTATNA
jgi:hypothetical protein